MRNELTDCVNWTRCRAAATLLALLVAAPALARADEAPAPTPNGLVIATEFSLSAATVSNSGTVGRTNVISGGFFGGYRLDRFILGVSIDITRLSTSDSQKGMVGPPDSSSSDTFLMLAPGVRVAILRSADRKLELFGNLDIGWIHVFSSETPESVSPTSETNNGIVYRIGPGLRYWISSNFAFHVLPTLRGQFQWATTSTNDGAFSRSRSIGLTTVEAGLGFLGVF